MNVRGELKMLLIEYGADVTCECSHGFTLLHDNSHAPLVPILIQKGLDINNAKNVYNWTPLYFAMVFDRVEVVEALMRYRPRLDYCQEKFCFHTPTPVEWLKENTPDLYKRWFRCRWTVVKCLVRFLALHKQAVISANHPLRKRSRGEFEECS